MSDTTAPAPQGAPPMAGAAESVRSAVESIRELLDVIVPPEVASVRDALGNDHPIRSALPAKVQIQVARHVERLLAHDPKGFRGAVNEGGIAGALSALLRAAEDPNVLAALSGAFEAAHPVAVSAARRLAMEAGAYAPGAPLDAADLFSIEEMAAGLLPFCVATIQRLVGLASGMLGRSRPEN